MRVPPPSAARRRPPAVRDGDLPDDREPEARARPAARRTGAIEAVEDVRKVFLVDAGPVVTHAQRAVAHRDLDVAVRRAPLRRVVEQVRDCALDRRRHSLHRRLLQVGREA